ncbi:tRNA dihydrouridine synthase DusB [Stygiobacter electus]|jgi:tRNA-dihydrouridine synthase B|uniref:tRNA-dihydrouridine synthase n=1 Tax=Stygiobacter electus TaxID=3032292 RepID=A0AAE3NY97_9BACT|nr:tRNA dihydrouridine synthase DusB [Stygiobacter electus]MDF1610805.1 tRNA dihydrouridine synthase DusB [Stygiobacter electus]
MKIGNLDIGDKLVLAPMAEITDSSFRKICKEFGAGLTFTQMVSAEGVIKNNFHTLKYLTFNKSEKPIAVQLLGNDPEIIGEATKEISKLKPDLIDINAGCPVDKVVSNKMGASLLDDPKALAKLISKMVDNSDGIPISTKIRLGKDKNHINVLETAKAIEDSGASVIIVHARTRNDKYEDNSEWHWIKKVKENIKIPVIGNGSVLTFLDAVEMKNETACDSVLIARGALGNPFIFSQYNSFVNNHNYFNVDLELILSTAIKHIDLLEREFGEFLALDKAKKHSLWYFKDQLGINELVELVLKTKSIIELKNVISNHARNITLNKFRNNDNKKISNYFNKRVLFWLSDESEKMYG